MQRWECTFAVPKIEVHCADPLTIRMRAMIDLLQTLSNKKRSGANVINKFNHSKAF